LSPTSVASPRLQGPRGQDPSRMQAVIKRQVEHMQRLIDDMLDLARVHSGKLRVERRRVDLAGVVEEVVFTCRPGMDARRQHVSMHIPQRVPPLDGDPLRLAQVFTNLLVNATKFTPEGGRIALVVEVAGDTVMVTVSDNGIGITAEALPNVFDPFVQ